MSRSKSLVLFLLAIFFVSALQLEEYSISFPNSWPKPKYNYSKEPLDQKQVQLGRLLFYEPLLSKDSSRSCESCHSPFNAFAHTDHALSHGIYDRIGKRNAPSLFNLAWQSDFMWDGAAKSLHEQAKFPITHPSEMGYNMNDLVNRLNTTEKYRSLFKQAFLSDTITAEDILKSLEAFMLSLISQSSKYDKVKARLDSFTAMELKGYTLFQNHCNSCHAEPLFSNYSFANNGLVIDDFLQDSGRYLITKDRSDLYKFKVPSLRNIEFSYPYMHDGRYNSLYEVLNHYSSLPLNSNFLAYELKSGISLSSHEKTELVAFLLTLSDKEFVFNPDYGFPRK